MTKSLEKLSLFIDFKKSMESSMKFQKLLVDVQTQSFKKNNCNDKTKEKLSLFFILSLMHFGMLGLGT